MAGENVIPKAAQAEADEAERVFREAQEAAQEPAPPAAETTEPEKAVETPPPEPAPAPAPAPAEATQPSEPEPAPEPQPVPELDELKAQMERLRHSHEVLKGKYSKEVPKLHAELRTEREARAKAEADLARAKKAQAAEPVDPANPYGLTQEQLELGPEVVAVAEKIAKRLTAQARAELEEKIPQRQAEPQPDPFWEALLIEEPDAWEINFHTPQFVEWLQGTVHGVTRGRLLKLAQDEGDAKRAAAMMADWKASVQSAAQPATKPTPTAKQATRPSLAAQVAPKTVGAPPAPAQKKTYTLAEYETVMTDISKGRYTPQRAKELEAEFDQAIREGRVR